MTSDASDDRRPEEPTREELQEPSTEKEPGEEPKAAHPDQPDPDHEAVGIGIVDSETPPTEGG